MVLPNVPAILQEELASPFMARIMAAERPRTRSDSAEDKQATPLIHARVSSESSGSADVDFEELSLPGKATGEDHGEVYENGVAMRDDAPAVSVLRCKRALLVDSGADVDA